RLLSLYAPVVCRWVRRAGITGPDQDDVSQDVFRAVARGVASFRRDQGSGSFAAWVATLTRHAVADHFRRRSGEPAAVGGSDFQQRLDQQPAPEEDSSSGGAGPSPRREVVRSALDLVRGEFESKTWQAFWRTA